MAQSCEGAEALAMRETYGLILLDLVLGKEDGLAIMRRIRARLRNHLRRGSAERPAEPAGTSSA